MSDPFIGQITLFGGNFAPRNWAFCNGQIMGISQNSALFSILGTNYGGDGITTFALPDLRGRAAIGTGQGPGLSDIQLGQLSGVEETLLQASNLPSHSHALLGTSAGGNAEAPANGLLASGSGISLYATGAAANEAMSPASIGATGGGLPISIRNPYLGLSYIIALTGVYPSRN